MNPLRTAVLLLCVLLLTGCEQTTGLFEGEERQQPGGDEAAATEETETVIDVLAAADEEYRKSIDWRADIEERMDKASEVFEELFNIRLQLVDIAKWASSEIDVEKAENAPMLFQLKQQLKSQVEADGADLVVGFSKQPFTREEKEEVSTSEDTTTAVAELFGTYVIVRDIPDDTWREIFNGFQPLVPEEVRRVRTIVHEIGHTFGAVHVEDEDSVMGKSKSLDFDPLNREIIKLVGKNRMPEIVKKSDLIDDYFDLTFDTWGDGALVSLSVSWFTVDDFVSARHMALLQTKLDSEDADGYKALAFANEKLGKKKEAQAALKRASELEPSE